MKHFTSRQELYPVQDEADDIDYCQEFHLSLKAIIRVLSLHACVNTFLIRGPHHI